MADNSGSSGVGGLGDSTTTATTATTATTHTHTHTHTMARARVERQMYQSWWFEVFLQFMSSAHTSIGSLSVFHRSTSPLASPSEYL